MCLQSNSVGLEILLSKLFPTRAIPLVNWRTWENLCYGGERESYRERT
jgi:hypothetical protein